MSLPPIAWDMPWFAPWKALGEPAAGRVARGMAPHDALNLQDGAPVRFTPQDFLPAGVAYERHIFDSGTCPTRPGLHDFFNGLCWLRMPLSKARLNSLQAAQLPGGVAPSGTPGTRGPVRDAITVFDENGALLDAPPALWDALRAHDWQRLFVELRPLWAQARVLVVGHALLEKLVAPRKELCAHVWHAQCALDSIASADAWLAGALTPQSLAAKPFTPLPLLGIPGWWAENQNFSFYDDSLVFRPARRQESIKPGRPPA